ncbi:L,D-transpeptidase [Actinacidiphila acididurans]|uniref:L,D-transpeptidase family protein n=1 Tax=Actinacidiphila acididurans TaxID=2784346 RepID=A0ABS2TML3_9ACTN|nr:Ig-like domain-containing protein [Actinacidiphila acididurans]MBM9504585.1 L,D-transpeptidase family protein [Actinacidiphila acididurans]
MTTPHDAGNSPEQQPAATRRRSPFTRRRTFTAIAALTVATAALTALGTQANAATPSAKPAAAKAGSASPVATGVPLAAKQAAAPAQGVAKSFVGTFTPEDGSTVGVGMPVSINFDKPITDKVAVQSHISVTSSSGQQVVGHWFSSTRLDLRPQAYWKAGSHVTMKLNLGGVKGGAGIYGVQNKTVNFTVGRSQVSTVDTVTHMMTVVRDGKVIRTIPVSSGGPGHETYNGQMVISEKDQTTRMNGATVGLIDKTTGKSEYDIPDVPHAMRLTTSGTFIHGNYWAAPSAFGTANTSHGCIGMQDAKGGNDPNTPASWFYNNSLIGDVVTVTGSPSPTVPADNGLNGWNLSWSQWLAGSAL